MGTLLLGLASQTDHEAQSRSRRPANHRGLQRFGCHEDLPKNLVGFIGTQTLRVAKKASQRLVGRAMFLSMGAATVDVEGFMDLLRASKTFAIALERLKGADILAPNLSPADVADIHVGRILTAGMLLEHADRHD